MSNPKEEISVRISKKDIPNLVKDLVLLMCDRISSIPLFAESKVFVVLQLPEEEKS